MESLALLLASKADLAVARADLDMPANAETVAIVRNNFVVLWSPSDLPGKSSKKQTAPKIKEIADRVGVIGRSPGNVALLRVILSSAGVALAKVAVTQFGTGQIKELAHDPTIDASWQSDRWTAKSPLTQSPRPRVRGVSRNFFRSTRREVTAAGPGFEAVAAGKLKSAPVAPDMSTPTVRY